MKAALALVWIALAGLLGLASADALLGSTAATPVSGSWRGGGHLLTLSGSLESGFAVAAGESWLSAGCPIKPGDVLTRYAPAGGSSYAATYLWIENTNGVCTSSTRGPETVTVVGGATTISITGCGYAFCGSLSRVGAAPTTTTKPPATTTRPATTTTRPTTTTTAAKDASPPRVKALTKGATKPASRSKLLFSVSDDSGSARVTVTLFEGGEQVGQTSSGWGPANGSNWWWDVLFRSDLNGPMYFCARAEDRAGNRSATSCAWISLVAPLARVSNGCGGGGWDALVAVQNYFGNEHTYQQSLLRSFSVNFEEACNLHDAAYGGHTVKDTLNGDVVTDFHSWSRPRIDRKFLGDMRGLCDAKIPAWAKNAREKCYSTGGSLSIGSLALYNFVAKNGWRFFDADLLTPGIQKRGQRANF